MLDKKVVELLNQQVNKEFYSAYASYPVRGSFALTQRGQQVVELLDVQGID